MNVPSLIFVFDCESIGLHGETYAVAGGLYRVTGETATPLDEFCYAVLPVFAAGRDEDRAWVRQNVPPIAVTHEDRGLMRDHFWIKWDTAKKLGAQMFVECGWPVESRFLAECIFDRMSERLWEGPYPLHEIASFMAAAGMDPMVKYPRSANELPEHDPMGDARLSARLLCEAFIKLTLP